MRVGDNARLRAAARAHNSYKKRQQPTRVAPLALRGKDGEGLGDVLRKYGVVALVFHFSVWLTTLSASVAALSVYDTSTLLEALPEPRGQIPLSSGAATLPVALALCEVVGPARLALTVAATPAVAGALRSNARFVELELGERAARGAAAWWWWLRLIFCDVPSCRSDEG